MEKHYRFDEQPMGYCMSRLQWLMLWTNPIHNEYGGYDSLAAAAEVFDQRTDFVSFPADHADCTEFFFVDRYSYLYDQANGYLDTLEEFQERDSGRDARRRAWREMTPFPLPYKVKQVR